METLKDLKGPVTESALYMWRAIFAMAHADHVVTNEEKRFMNRILYEIDFTPEQEALLKNDIEFSQDVGEMFAKIDNSRDRSRFFHFARMLLWCDGDFDEQEQKILTNLASYHTQTVDIDSLIEENDLRLEDDDRDAMVQAMSDADKTSVLSRFFKSFES